MILKFVLDSFKNKCFIIIIIIIDGTLHRPRSNLEASPEEAQGLGEGGGVGGLRGREALGRRQVAGGLLQGAATTWCKGKG